MPVRMGTIRFIVLYVKYTTLFPQKQTYIPNKCLKFVLTNVCSGDILDIDRTNVLNIIETDTIFLG